MLTALTGIYALSTANYYCQLYRLPLEPQVLVLVFGCSAADRNDRHCWSDVISPNDFVS